MSDPLTKIARYGNTFEVVYFEKPLLSTPGGGILNNKHRQRGTSTLKLAHNIRRAKRRVKRIVSAVTAVKGPPLFVTLTYAPKVAGDSSTQVHDMQQAIEDWRAFTRRMKKKFSDAGFVRVPERHQSGAVHFHMAVWGLPLTLGCMYKKRGFRWVHTCPKERPCERKLRVLRAVWGHGHVDVQVVRNSNRVGAYLANYLTKKPKKGSKEVEQDLSLFGHQVASCNRKMYDYVNEAKKAGYYYELSSYASPVAVSMVLEDMHDVSEVVDLKAFKTKWLGEARMRLYRIHTPSVVGQSASLEQGNVGKQVPDPATNPTQQQLDENGPAGIL